MCLRVGDMPSGPPCHRPPTGVAPVLPVDPVDEPLKSSSDDATSSIHR